MPKMAPRSSDAIFGARPLAPIRAAGIGCWMRSRWSTPRSRKSVSGDASRRWPTPYIAAATCLHIPAESGQLHRIEISFGFGNRPCPRSVTVSMTALDSLPCRSSTSVPILPAHCFLSASHCGAGRAATSMRTSYRSDPLTSAATLPAAIFRSTTEPLRTYVRPRGRRFSKSLYPSRLVHHAWPQNVVAIDRPAMTTGAADCPFLARLATSLAAWARRRATGT